MNKNYDYYEKLIHYSDSDLYYLKRRSKDSKLYLPDLWDLVFFIVVAVVGSIWNHSSVVAVENAKTFAAGSIVSCAIFITLVDVAAIFMFNFWLRKSYGMLLYTICVLTVEASIHHLYFCIFSEIPYFNSSFLFTFLHSVGVCAIIVFPAAIFYRARYFSKSIKLRDYVEFKSIKSGFIRLEYHGKTVVCKMAVKDGLLSFYKLNGRRFHYAVSVMEVGCCQLMQGRIIITDSFDNMLFSITANDYSEVERAFNLIKAEMENS